MKLLIDVPDKEYNQIKEWDDSITGYQTSLVLYRAVRNGTPYENKDEWIPITFRQATDDEYKEFIRRFDDIPREECKVYECRMPDDGQEVLITTSWGAVCEDTYHADDVLAGFEDHDDPDDVIAWMPKPKAYKKEEES